MISLTKFNCYTYKFNWNEEAKKDTFLTCFLDQIAYCILEMYPGTNSVMTMKTIVVVLSF